MLYRYLDTPETPATDTTESTLTEDDLALPWRGPDPNGSA
jgi:hypothetical protein